MKNTLIRLLTITSLAAFVVFFLPKLAFASTLNLSPGSGSISIGTITSVRVRLNSGGDVVNAVSAFLSYPADKLDVAWVSPSSTFAIEAENTFGGGIIKISRGSLSGVSGNVNVATIGFKGKSAGSATVAFIGGSAAPRASDSADSLSLGGSSGGVYNVVQGTPQPTPFTSSVDQKQPPAQLLISETKVTAISTNSATVTWKTNAAADSLVEYGLEKGKYFLSASNGELMTDHKVKLENVLLTAGLNLHFRVKSKDISGQEVIGEDQELQLLGYQVKVKVIDEAGKPVSGVEVLLYSAPRKAITNANGEAIFENVSPGKHLAVVKSSDGDKSAEVLVMASKISTPYVTIKINKIAAAKQSAQSAQTQTIIQALVITGIIFVLVVIVIVVVIVKKRKKQAIPPPVSPPVNPMGINNSS